MKFLVDGRQVDLPLEAGVVAGFTGRDQAEARRHVAELASIGVPRPARVPAFYLVPGASLIQAREIRVTHGATSGEAEIVLLVSQEALYVTVGSDHTDRAAERLDISLAKRACPKVLARQAWRMEEVEAHWDELELRSWVGRGEQGSLYQQGAAAELLGPDDLLKRIRFRRRPECFAVLMGTLPAIGGVRPGERFRAELRDPPGGRAIELDYRVRLLDILAGDG